MSVVDTATGYLEGGLCVLPAILEEKRPALPGWKQYQRRLPTERQVRAWFAEDVPLCVLAGAVSGHLEMIDFDFEAELFDRWRELVTSESNNLFERLVIERSQSGGRHVIYRCESPVSGNQKLAQRTLVVDSAASIEIGGKQCKPHRVNDHFEVTLTLIETRGEGGLFLCAPTPGYAHEQGAFEQIPVLSESERSLLIEAACSLNESIPPTLPSQGLGTPSGRPGDDYNERGDVQDLLRRHGWQRVRGGDNEYWRRPGKTQGWSATLRDRVLYVFSSNAAPFEPDRSYSPFSVYVHLEYGGDFPRAAMALREAGYGEAQDEDVDLSGILAGQWQANQSMEKPGDSNLKSLLPTKSVRELLNEYPSLRRPVIHGLLREGETMNVIASPKIGKSWLVVDLALAVATGQRWLGTFPTERGDVLIIDNELHRETSAHRIPKVMAARWIPPDSVVDRVFVANVRGGLKDIFGMAKYFQQLVPGRFKLIILDAFYRFMPKDSDENDNGTMSQVYNHLDEYAGRLGCSFVLVHHSSKGNQSGKGVTDVGAGAGSQSRATDTHLVLRPHEETDCVVLDAAVRSWPPIASRGLRWTFPVWTPDDSLDPEALRRERSRRKTKVDNDAKTADKATQPAWDAPRFATAFVSEIPAATSLIIQAAIEEGLSERHANRLLKLAEAEGQIHRWRYGANQPIRYATAPPPETSP